MKNLATIVSLVSLTVSDVVQSYEYGSRVYGTFDADSDYDYVIVTDKERFTIEQYHEGIINVSAYHIDIWNQMIQAHDIMALECIFTKSQSPENFTLSTSTLRNVISKVSSNSWVKCKKKLTVENDSRRVGIKSLFHSFRIPMFGIQLATTGHIYDYHCAVGLWDEMKVHLEDDMTWGVLKELYQKRHNALMTEFRSVASKE